MQSRWEKKGLVQEGQRPNSKTSNERNTKWREIHKKAFKNSQNWRIQVSTLKEPNEYPAQQVKKIHTDEHQCEISEPGG